MTLQGKLLLNHDLSLMGAPLTGIVLFAADLELHRSAVPVVAYIPGDPLAPLKYYADGTASCATWPTNCATPTTSVFQPLRQP